MSDSAVLPTGKTPLEIITGLSADLRNFSIGLSWPIGTKQQTKKSTKTTKLDPA
ncbi:hypothetical protein [Bradyrhizobium sp. USDA 4473]